MECQLTRTYTAQTRSIPWARILPAEKRSADGHPNGARTDDTRENSHAKLGRSVLARIRWVHRWPSAETPGGQVSENEVGWKSGNLGNLPVAHIARIAVC